MSSIHYEYDVFYAYAGYCQQAEKYGPRGSRWPFLYREKFGPPGYEFVSVVPEGVFDLPPEALIRFSAKKGEIRAAEVVETHGDLWFPQYWLDKPQSLYGGKRTYENDAHLLSVKLVEKRVGNLTHEWSFDLEDAGDPVRGIEFRICGGPYCSLNDFAGRQGKITFSYGHKRAVDDHGLSGEITFIGEVSRRGDQLFVRANTTPSWLYDYSFRFRHDLHGEVWPYPTGLKPAGHPCPWSGFNHYECFGIFVEDPEIFQGAEVICQVGRR